MWMGPWNTMVLSSEDGRVSASWKGRTDVIQIVFTRAPSPVPLCSDFTGESYRLRFEVPSDVEQRPVG